MLCETQYSKQKENFSRLIDNIHCKRPEANHRYQVHIIINENFSIFNSNITRACGFTGKITNNEIVSDFVQGKTQARVIFVVTIS